MISVMAFADKEAWAFGKRAEALERYCPDDMEIEAVAADSVPIESIAWQRCDIVFLLNTAVADNLRRHFKLLGNTHTKIIVSHNSGLIRRRDMLDKACLAGDYVIINNLAAYNSILKDCHQLRNFCNISNGVDLDTYYPTVPIENRPHRILWSGSRAKWDDPSDVKGSRRVLAPLMERYADAGFEFDYHIADKDNFKDGDAMRDFYNSGSYIICPSWSEGTPNIVLEAAACGCVPICGPIGNVPELFRNRKSYTMPRSSGVLTIQQDTGRQETYPLALDCDYWDALLWAKPRREEMSAAALKAIQPWDWSIRSQEFYRLFRAVAAGQCPEPFSWIDRRTDVHIASPAA